MPGFGPLAAWPIAAVPVGGAPASFGYQTGDGTGTNSQVAYTSEHDCSSYVNTTGNDVWVTSITLLDISLNGGFFQLALYADSGSNTPGALLGVTATDSSGGLGNKTLNLVNPVKVAAGARIWGAIRATGGMYCNGANHANDGLSFRYKTYSPGNAFTNPFGSTSSFNRIIPLRFNGTSPVSATTYNPGTGSVIIAGFSPMVSLVTQNVRVTWSGIEALRAGPYDVRLTWFGIEALRAGPYDVRLTWFGVEVLRSIANASSDDTQLWIIW